MRTQTQSIHLNVVNPGMLQSTDTSGYPRVSGVRVGVAVCGGCLGGDNSVWMVEGAGSAAHQH